MASVPLRRAAREDDVMEGDKGRGIQNGVAAALVRRCAVSAKRRNKSIMSPSKHAVAEEYRSARNGRKI